MSKNDLRMHGARWSESEEAYLRDLYGSGYSDGEIAPLLGRKEGAVYGRRIQLGLCEARGKRGGGE